MSRESVVKSSLYKVTFPCEMVKLISNLILCNEMVRFFSSQIACEPMVATVEFPADPNVTEKKPNVISLNLLTL